MGYADRIHNFISIGQGHFTSSPIGVTQFSMNNYGKKNRKKENKQFSCKLSKNVSTNLNETSALCKNFINSNSISIQTDLSEAAWEWGCVEYLNFYAFESLSSHRSLISSAVLSIVIQNELDLIMSGYLFFFMPRIIKQLRCCKSYGCVWICITIILKPHYLSHNIMLMEGLICYHKQEYLVPLVNIPQGQVRKVGVAGCS